MKLSERGLTAIKGHEGLRLKAYPDPGSVNGLPVTIGYGSTRTLDGGTWNLGDEITESQAEELLRFDLQDAERAVNRLVKVPLRQGQHDSLTSLVFNIGAGAFERSTLLRKLNAHDPTVADEFLRWVNNDGAPMEGLRRRRQAEREMFLEAAPIERRDSMSPFLIAALPALVEAIPGLIRNFGKGAVTERNAEAAERVISIVQAATGTTNAQAAVEAIKADPAARVAATEALDREGWFVVTEAGGGGIEGARKFVMDAASVPIRRMPAMWVTAAVMPLVYMVTSAVLYLPGFSPEMKGMVIGVVMTGALGAILAFWLGSSFGSQRKDSALLR